MSKASTPVPRFVQDERRIANLALREAELAETLALGRVAMARIGAALAKDVARAKGKLSIIQANQLLPILDAASNSATQKLACARMRARHASMAPAVVMSSLLQAAVAKGTLEDIHALLRAGASPNTPDETGRSQLLLLSGKKSKLPVLKLLLENGAQDAPDGLGRTALLAAVSWRHAEAVSLLLLHGSNPHALDAQGRTALFLALDNRDVASARELIPYSDVGPLHGEAVSTLHRPDETPIDCVRRWALIEPDNEEVQALSAMIESRDIGAGLSPATAAPARAPRL